MSTIQERLAAMPADTREMVLRQLRRKQEALRNRIKPQPRDERPFPLSFAQERMWFLHQLDPDSAQYNVSVTICLTGRLDVDVLQRSVDVLVQRHEAVRTTFDVVDGQPVQHVAAAGQLPVNVTDLRQAAHGEEAFYRLARQELQRPFRLQHAPPVRFHLYRLTATDARLLLVMHHIISDGWSLGVLAKELAAVYTRLYNRQQLVLRDLSVQCADFAVWQREWLQGETREKLLRYWQKQLAGAPKSLNLPTDRPRPAEQTLQGARVPLQVPRDLQQQLQEICRREGVTMFMLLLTGFAALLSRLAQQEDLVIGTPILNRQQEQTVSIVGAFVNTLALRIDLSGAPTARALLQRVQQVVLDGMEHQQMPFARLVDLLGLERSLTRSPLFQVSFGYQDNPLQAMRMPGLDVELLEVRQLLQDGTLPPLDTGMAMFDLTFHLSQIAAGVGGWIEYNSDLFDAMTVERMGARYLLLLAALAADLDQPVAALPLLLPVERKEMKVLVGEKRPLPSNPRLHALFAATAAGYPGKIAAEELDRSSGSRRTITFADLQQRSHQLAHYLQQQGIQPETPVGICATRSLEMLVAVLGVLQAGGTYVPLAPDYPAERLAYMVADAGIELLLTQRALLEKLPAHEARVLCLDRDWPDVAAQPQTAPASDVAPDNAAYIIYTSGSTGRPKGVVVTHRNACNLVLAQIEAFVLTPQSRSLQFASFSFDAAVSEIFTTLVSGATLVLVPAEQIVPGDDLRTLLHDEAISVVTLPPSATMTLGDAPLPHLRTLVSAGEACPWELADVWGNGRRLLNFYGPTEATVGACYHPVTGRLPGPLTVPIGRPIPNAELLVVDANLQPLPPGVPGELLIGGMGVARGYLRRPQLSATRFVPHPAGDASKVYRTGDLVRFWPSGDLEFMGRIDQQVKLHGFRIEPGEIEAVLRQHPALREAVVILREDQPGSPRLVAYFIAEEGEEVTLPLLRRYLQTHLPDYMIPAAFVPLAEWPLTSNGKVDRAALPSPEKGRLESGQYMVAARDDVEKALTAIWQELLQVEAVSIHDNFFELGGDSIMSIQMVTRAREAGVHLSPRQVFRQQTIAELAAVANRVPAVQAQQDVVTGTVPLTPIQRWFFAQEFAQPHHWNQSVMLVVERRLERPFLEKALTALHHHHDVLRARFVPGEEGWRQEILPPGAEIPLSMVDLADVRDASWESTLAAYCDLAQAALDLERGPLFSAVYFDGGSARAGRLLFVAHHLLVDAMSWPILLADFWTAYEQAAAYTAVSLPPKTTSWLQWSKRLQAYAQQLEADVLAYWQQAHTPPPLPLDFADGLLQNSEATTRRVTLSLDAGMTAALLHEVPPVYNTQIQEVLAAALLLAWQTWTGSATLLLDVEGHGREPIFADVDVSRTVGWFTTLYPVWLAVSDVTDLGAVLIAVKEQMRSVPGNGLPYGLLRYVRGAATLQELPQAAISLNYLGQLTPRDDLPLAPEPTGAVRAAACGRAHLVEVEGRVENGRLHLAWLYSSDLHRHETIAGVAHHFLAALQSLITHCRQPNAGDISPSDFPEAELDQQGLDNVLAELDGLFG